MVLIVADWKTNHWMVHSLLKCKYLEVWSWELVRKIFVFLKVNEMIVRCKLRPVRRQLSEDIDNCSTDEKQDLYFNTYNSKFCFCTKHDQYPCWCKCRDKTDATYLERSLWKSPFWWLWREPCHHRQSYALYNGSFFLYNHERITTKVYPDINRKNW